MAPAWFPCISTPHQRAPAVRQEAHRMATVLTNVDNPFNQQFGNPTERVANKVKDTLPEPVKAFIRQSPFIVMATSNREGWCDASPKGGMPGFVKILDNQHLLIPDITGNKL